MADRASRARTQTPCWRGAPPGSGSTAETRMPAGRSGQMSLAAVSRCAGPPLPPRAPPSSECQTRHAAAALCTPSACTGASLNMSHPVRITDDIPQLFACMPHTALLDHLRLDASNHSSFLVHCGEEIIALAHLASRRGSFKLDLPAPAELAPATTACAVPFSLPAFFTMLVCPARPATLRTYSEVSTLRCISCWPLDSSVWLRLASSRLGPDAMCAMPCAFLASRFCCALRGACAAMPGAACPLLSSPLLCANLLYIYICSKHVCNKPKNTHHKQETQDAVQQVTTARSPAHRKLVTVTHPALVNRISSSPS